MIKYPNFSYIIISVWTITEKTLLKYLNYKFLAVISSTSYWKDNKESSPNSFLIVNEF